MANRRGVLFLALALVLGILAFLMAQRFARRAEPLPSAPVATVPVVVARTDMSVATTLQPLQLRTIAWPEAHVPPGALTEADAAVGRVLRRPVGAGEPILEAALFDKGAAGGLAAVIPPHKRGVSVKVDNVIGVAGFVQPGARVDVLATLRRIDQNKALPYSKIILQDVRVLAVDQKLEAVDGGEPEQVNVVTLEVGPEDAEHLVYAAHEGRLQLAMRTPGDQEVVATRSVGVVDLLENGSAPEPTPVRAAAGPPRRHGPTVQVLRGSELEVQHF